MASRIDPAVRAGGWSLIVASTLFMVVFAYLAATFDYPAVLDGPASDVLPRLRSLGPMGRAVWGLYAFIPLLLVPAAGGARARFGDVAPGAMRAAEAFAVVAAFSMMLGLLRWPSIYWSLAGLYPTGSEAEQAAITAVFVGLNAYLGNFVGELLGELCLNLFFALTSYAMLNVTGVPRWLAYVGGGASSVGFLGMFRNITPTMAPFAQLYNVVLPIWMIVLGASLAFGSSRPSKAPL